MHVTLPQLGMKGDKTAGKKAGYEVLEWLNALRYFQITVNQKKAVSELTDFQIEYFLVTV